MHRLIFTAALLFGAVACVGPGLMTDGTSVSVWTTSSGALRNGTTLPFRGEGYIMPKRWKARRRNYGTDELVRLLVRSARRVNRIHRNSLLGVADLSPRGGGPTPEHRSHRSGRDVDLLIYAQDTAGKPVRPRSMVKFDRNGISEQPSTLPSPAAPPGPVAAPPGPVTAGAATPDLPQKLDIPRNWALMKAMVTDPEVSVQWIFIGRPIIRKLLVYARRKREPAHIIERVASLLHQPSDAQSHMDHMHIRVFCSLSDRAQGCVDRGPVRWLKKDIKYVDAPPSAKSHVPFGLTRLSLRPFRLMGL